MNKRIQIICILLFFNKLLSKIHLNKKGWYKNMSFDPAFGTSNFGTPKSYSETETLARNILAVLFAKPGSYPTMPNFGMNIPDLVMSFYDDIDESELKNELVSTCSSFTQVVKNGEFDIIKSVLKDTNNVDTPVLLIKIPTIIKKTSKSLLIGVMQSGKQVKYNFTWADE